MIGDATGGRHFACTMPSVMLKLLRKEGGVEAVADVLERAGSPRTPEYLEDVTNWISWDEALALFDAVEDYTGDPGIARRIGEHPRFAALEAVVVAAQARLARHRTASR